nr:chaperone protein ClpB3, chloroplastic-like [Tanacetum cinerariifolium]
MAWKAIVSSPEVAKENMHQIVESGHLLNEQQEIHLNQGRQLKKTKAMYPNWISHPKMATKVTFTDDIKMLTTTDT